MSEENLQILEKLKPDLSIRKEKIVSEEELLSVFSKAILKILRTNHQRIIQVLYRHDINEKKATEAFKLMNDEDIANALAQLLIDREKQKIAIRKKYAHYNANDQASL
jgi:hypothetical protein